MPAGPPRRASPAKVKWCVSCSSPWERRERNCSRAQKIVFTGPRTDLRQRRFPSECAFAAECRRSCQNCRNTCSPAAGSRCGQTGHNRNRLPGYKYCDSFGTTSGTRPQRHTHWGNAVGADQLRGPVNTIFLSPRAVSLPAAPKEKNIETHHFTLAGLARRGGPAGIRPLAGNCANARAHGQDPRPRNQSDGASQAGGR